VFSRPRVVGGRREDRLDLERTRIGVRSADECRPTGKMWRGERVAGCADPGAASPGDVDIEAVGAEVSVVVKAIQRATEMLEAGDTREVSFKSDKMMTLIRVINDSYFVAMTLSPEGNFGKGRYMLRLLAPQLKSELE